MNRSTCLAVAAAATAFTLATPAAQASEPLFGYVYTTDTLPKGKSEIEQWITDNDGQAHGYYHGIDGSTEYEYGISDKVQLGVYLNYAYIDAKNNSVAGHSEGLDIRRTHNPLLPFSASHLDGVSAELVYRVLSPYTAPIGLAFYAEPEIGKEDGLELRAIVQKNFMDDRLVLAANSWIEFDEEPASNLGALDEMPDTKKSKSTYVEYDLGLSYRYRPNWSAGLEFRNHNEFAGFSVSHSVQDHTAFFFGPNIHYGSEKWFFTLSALYQLGATAYTDDQKAQMYNHHLYGDEHTNWDGIRLKIGRAF